MKMKYLEKNLNYAFTFTLEYRRIQYNLYRTIKNSEMA